MDTSLMYLTVFLTLATCQSDDTTSIDFSDGTVDEDGVVCVEREEEMDKVEQQQVGHINHLYFIMDKDKLQVNKWLSSNFWN